MSNTVARIIIYLLIGVPIAYDAVALTLGWPTISATVRVIDTQSGSLFRWLLLGGLLGCWCHFFLSKPWGGWGN